MDYLKHKKINRERRAHKVRTTVVGSLERPRLSVHISNLHISAQIINDDDGTTVAYATTVGQKVDGNKSKKAEWIGREIAKKAKKAKVTKVVFDRGHRKYHGRVKVLADAAREDGLEF